MKNYFKFTNNLDNNEIFINTAVSITNKVKEKIKEWQSMPVEPICAF